MFNVQDIHQQIMKLPMTDDLLFFILDSDDIIHRHYAMLKKPITVNFFKGSDSTQNIKQTMENKALCKEYIDILQKHGFAKHKISFSINDEPELKKFCNHCNSDSITKHYEDQYLTCECGLQFQKSNLLSSSKDAERINFPPKYTPYDRTSHFEKCIFQYEGKDTGAISIEMLSTIRQHFINNRSHSNIHFIKKNEILECLSVLGFTEKKYSDEINFIHHELTGNIQKNISMLKKELMCDFSILSDLYDNVFKYKKIDLNLDDSMFQLAKQRKNFIDSDFVLFQFLKKYEFPCDISEFNILKTVDRQLFHENVCQALFDYLGWNFHSIF